MSLGSLPFRTIYEALRKLQIVYANLTHKILIYNSSGIGFVWRLVKPLLPETTKYKILFINSESKDELMELIDEKELEEKLGGILPNYKVYWPPKGVTTNHARLSSTSL